jgi:hypothetical protein
MVSFFNLTGCGDNVELEEGEKSRKLKRKMK